MLPADRMADNAQRVLALPGGLELGPWRTTLLPTPTEDEARAYRADAGAVGEGDGGGVGGCAGERGPRGGRPDEHRHRPRRRSAGRARPEPPPRRHPPLEGTMRHALLHADGRHDQHLHARVRGYD
ncbi:hypothetical protein [Streptomyces sp. Root369]|uniref:hypothetical protein n=1 Tax=Streptomyces sp. Root369 TaxID=1736523 RepID=UPI000ABA5200|nr:hypothetical protein [Streptomyces sp. Root369]